MKHKRSFPWVAVSGLALAFIGVVHAETEAPTASDAYIRITYCIAIGGAIGLIIAQLIAEVRRLPITIEEAVRRGLPSELEVYTRREANARICEMLKNAKLLPRITRARNTTFVPEELADKVISEPYTGSVSHAIQVCVSSGAAFEEILSLPLRTIAQRRAEKCVSGIYRAYLLDTTSFPVLNFIVFDFDNGNSEVWFGWLIKHQNDTYADCFRSRNRKLVNLFMGWWDDMEHVSKKHSAI